MVSEEEEFTGRNAPDLIREGKFLRLRRPRITRGVFVARSCFARHSTRVIHAASVDVQAVRTEADMIKRSGNAALDEIQRGLWGKAKDHHLSPSRKALGKPAGWPQILPVNKFVDQDVIPWQQAVHHRGARDLKHLDEKGARKKSQEDGGQNRAREQQEDRERIPHPVGKISGSGQKTGPSGTR